MRSPETYPIGVILGASQLVSRFNHFTIESGVLCLFDDEGDEFMIEPVDLREDFLVSSSFF